MEQNGRYSAISTSTSAMAQSEDFHNNVPLNIKQRKKWRFEYQRGHHLLVAENSSSDNIVFVYKCINCTITVKGTVNSVVIDQCSDVTVVLDTVGGAVGILNSLAIRLRVRMFHKVATVSIERSSTCNIYLSSHSLDAEVITLKSTDVALLIPNTYGDFVRQTVPQKFSTRLTQDGELETFLVIKR
ncbi:adenylyl cyclase-associated protein 1-like [Euwallacea similis]|uniref:adenylyl cyclase-associated protein 1-like n=1 Tax=Euwallacea similis TaxID=1736056 RepID=UPI00344E997B